MANAVLDPALRALTAQMAEMQARIQQLERNQRSGYNIQNTSIDGDNLVINDASGNPAVVVGLQSDGTYGIAGVGNAVPVNPPDTPLVTPGIGSLLVTWDGLMAGGQPPLNFSMVQVHCSTQTGFVPGAATLQGSMPSAGLFTIGGLTPGTTYFVGLVPVNQQGNTGPVSTQVAGVPLSVAGGITPGSITAGMVNFTASAIGGPTVSIGPVSPPGPNVNDIWYNASAQYQMNQWNGTSWVPAQFGTGAIAAGSITAALIAANSITSGQIVAGGITAQAIAAQAIQAVHIAAGAVTANSIQAGTIFAGIVDGTTVQAGQFIGSGTRGQYLGYTGTPGAGNLFIAISPFGGSDAYSNPFGIGISMFYGTNTLALLVDPYANCPAIHMPTGIASENGYASIYNYPVNRGLANEFENVWFQGPSSITDGASAAIALCNSARDGSLYANGQLVCNPGGGAPGRITATWNAWPPAPGFHLNDPLYGTGGILTIGDSILCANPNSGPYLSAANGGTWQSIGLPTGVTGTVRVKLLPWNVAMLDIAVNIVGNTSGATYTLGNLPSNCIPTTLNPSGSRLYPIGGNDAVTTTNTQRDRIYMNSTGGLQIIIVPNTGTGTASFAATIIYPVD